MPAGDVKRCTYIIPTFTDIFIYLFIFSFFLLSENGIMKEFYKHVPFLSLSLSLSLSLNISSSFTGFLLVN